MKKKILDILAKCQRLKIIQLYKLCEGFQYFLNKIKYLNKFENLLKFFTKKFYKQIVKLKFE